MINALIDWSIRNRILILLGTVGFIAWGIYAAFNTPLGAIPNLTPPQVIVKAPYPGQAPQVVEDQVTYPLATTLMSVPGAVTVRGYSMFGISYVYVLFKYGTSTDTARARVLEYLNQAQSQLPAGVTAVLGPDATSVDWIYEYALISPDGKYNLAQLTTLQNWQLKYELEQVPGVTQVATVGGMVKEFQVVVDPARLLAYRIPLSAVERAIRRANAETSGSVVDHAGSEYMVRTTGYVKTLTSLRRIPVGSYKGTPVFLGNIAHIQYGPALRRSVAELNGKGQVVGGIVLMQEGANALRTVERVQRRIAQLQKTLPKGVRIVETYSQGPLIEHTVHTLSHKLLEESLAVALVCIIFLFHLRSSLVAIISLPIGMLAAFLVMYLVGAEANIMSISGIAIAIGAMVDAAIVTIENMHKHIERSSKGPSPWALAWAASIEVGPALFFSLLIIALSFLPVFALQAQEGQLFHPLALTETVALAAAALLAVTLIPVLMGYLVRGHIVSEHRNPVNRVLAWLYRPLIHWVLEHKLLTILASIALILSMLYPLGHLRSEFMPPLNEGTLYYMPTTIPSISIGEATYDLQQTDKILKSFPEVAWVFGKAGRADTATDPSPLSMFGTIVQLKPRGEWPRGMTVNRLIAQLHHAVRIPGLKDMWTMPVRARTDMLSTGLPTPLGIKIAGPRLDEIARIGRRIEDVLRALPGTQTVYADRVTGGLYYVAHVHRRIAARYGINVRDVNDLIETAIGGKTVTTAIDGLDRFPINLRYPRALRQSVSALSNSFIATPEGAQVPLGQLASVTVSDGPPEIKLEGARLNGWVYILLKPGIGLGRYVQRAKARLGEEIHLPAGYTIRWAGQYRYMEQAKRRLEGVIPLTLLLVVVLLYLNFRNFTEVAIILISLPFAAAGGVWLIYFLGYKFSVAVAVGFIALIGVASEFAVVMLVYLDQALHRHEKENRIATWHDLKLVIIEGTLLRLRPMAMTLFVVVGGLLPIMFGEGTGSQVMRRIAAPMIGGMVTAALLGLLGIPVLYAFWKRRALGLME